MTFDDMQSVGGRIRGWIEREAQLVSLTLMLMLTCVVCASDAVDFIEQHLAL
jgi:hypothetical protein